MRLRDQIIVIMAIVVATSAVAVNVFAQSRADDRRAENERVAVAAAWAQPVEPTTTSTPDTTNVSDPGEPVENGVSTAPGQNKEDCIPPGQVDRDEDKNAPPGLDRDLCVPPGQDKDKDTPPGQVDRDEDKNVPPGQNKDEATSTPPGQAKDKNKETSSTPPGQAKDKDKG